MMKKKMSMMGIGMKLILYTAAYAGFATALTFFFPQVFIIRTAREFGLPLLGYILLAIGIPLLAISARQITTKFDAGKLMTEGFFRYSRNPIYAVWLFFLLPAFSLLSTSWIFFGVPFAFYLVFDRFIREEEDYLTEEFGQEYLDYKARTGRLLPRLKG